MLLELSDSKAFDKGFFDKSGNTIDRIWPVMNSVQNSSATIQSITPCEGRT